MEDSKSTTVETKPTVGEVLTDTKTEENVTTATNEKSNENVTTKNVEGDDSTMSDKKQNDTEKDSGLIERKVKAPLFLMFAEYLGLVSKVITWAEDWCNGNKPSDFKRKVIETDASNLFKIAKRVYTKEELAEYYDEFYEVILSEYDENLKKLETAEILKEF